ncbi:hypothetical protein AB2N08_20280 [Massilia aurea]|uniref:hypothetical protein n=1 Tax=Massilia aurea TaxID=373040 RepID=UPI0034631247
MRRHFVILLLFAMPLQSAWAAGAAGGSHDDNGVHAAHRVHERASSENCNAAVPANGQPVHRADGDARRRLAASAVLSSQPNLPLPKGAPHMRGETRRYV